MKKPLVIANWKMNTTVAEARQLAKQIRMQLASEVELLSACSIVLCPPSVNLHAVFEEIQGSPLLLGGQNCWTEPYGAYTGEVSASMLRAIGCSYVLVGHSERRSIFHEDDEMILRKMERVWEEGLIPVLCIGETLHQRQTHQTWNVLKRQLDMTLSHQYRSRVWVCAYEPVWAIGTGIAAEPEQIEQAHAYLRSLLDGHNCRHVPILYGGSVSPENASVIFRIPYVDGVLVGGASLSANSFVAIARESAYAATTGR
ncbi:MAG: triose-phosphate isomerase [Bacteroidota bacterium]|nr:triose-phosphate isomerase [Candidatus Kapabacteria bacterium]MCS7302631.1 triose-phosphate isomerase [Candidatus Kapabacteria bacterium]MCX7936254.1 triose-phosphate isomerase [Chlorobiota bacterium]MDW8074465.1 triose-phosphate isomerase [Bacteroidota bacterium]MDW8271059.1 triose-phosphate isomerase [Bacteroidota bacterium]